MRSISHDFTSAENPLGPFEGADTDAEVKKLIYSLIRVTISFTLYNHEVRTSPFMN